MMDLWDDDFFSPPKTTKRTVKFNVNLRGNKKINLPKPSKSSPYDDSSAPPKIHYVADNEQEKNFQSEIPAITKSAKASYEISRMDAPQNESSDVHDLSFSADGQIESLENMAHHCNNMNDLEAPSLFENDGLQIVGVEQTIYHAEESNFKDCTPSIMQNDEAGKLCGTSVDNIAITSQNTKNIMSEMDDGDYEGDVPKQKKIKLPKRSCNISCERESPMKCRKKKSEESASKDSPKKRLTHGTSRRKGNEIDVNEEKILPEDRSQLVIRDLIRLAGFKEQKDKKVAAVANYFTENQSEEHDQDKHDDDANTETQKNCKPRKLNYHSYLKRPVQTKWSNSDTEVFYQAIKQFGTDFEMIKVLFPGRSRQQVKAKFKNEQRKYPLRITDALVHGSKDHSHFEKVIQHLQTLAEEKAKKEASDLAATSQDETNQNENVKTEASPEKEQEPNHCEDYLYEDAHTTTEFGVNENDFD